MRDQLPPMQSLRCFESAARLKSISKAASELCVTQGAVSKQIKLLESFLDTALFNRTANGIALTDSGSLYLDVVVESLNKLNAIGESLQKNPTKQKLLLDMIPSMSNIWFIPKIHMFEKSHPYLKVDLINGDGQPDFNQSQADIYIRCLMAKDTKQHSIELFKERLVLVISPSLLINRTIEKVADIIHFNLIQQTTRTSMWQHFFEYNNMPTNPQAKLGMGFQHFFMSLKAAEEGLGIALIPDFLAKQSIDKGLLINPLNLSIHSEYRYYLFSPSYKADSKKVLAFNEWLLQQFDENH